MLFLQLQPQNHWACYQFCARMFFWHSSLTYWYKSKFPNFKGFPAKLKSISEFLWLQNNRQSSAYYKAYQFHLLALGGHLYVCCKVVVLKVSPEEHLVIAHSNLTTQLKQTCMRSVRKHFMTYNAEVENFWKEIVIFSDHTSKSKWKRR